MGADDRGYDTDFLESLCRCVTVGDGAMGTPPQAADLDETRPDVIETKYVRLQSG